MRARVAVVISGLMIIGATGCTSGSSNESSAGNHGGAGGQGAAGAAPAAAAPSTPRTAPRGAPTPPDQSLVRTADITMFVRDITRQADRARAVAIAARGEVAKDDRAGDGRTTSADLVLKVPTANSDRVLDQLAGLGQAGSRDISSTDVGQTVVDLNSRVASMRAAIARLRGLYARAGTVAEVLAVEAQLSQREADLEGLEAQQRSLADQTALAAIMVHLRAAAVPPKPTHRAVGVVQDLQRGWAALTATAGWLLTVVSTALPFLVIGALLVVVTIYRRRLRRGSRAGCSS